MRHGLVIEAQEPARIAEQQFAVAGDRDLSRLALEELASEQLLQLLHLKADRRGAAVNPFGGA